jgi:UDP-2,3-diacylglucosamine pyrophosphatase LpxH
MGVHFRVQDANIIAYLTTRNLKPPRITYAELINFSAVLRGEGEETPEHLFSSSSEWIENVEGAADQAWKEVRKDLDSHVGSDEEVPRDRLTTLLAVLRNLLSGYNLFGLAVGSWTQDQQLNAFTRYAAIDSLHHALFLIPSGWGPRDAIRLRDPFPAIALAAEASDEWPGMVFWSQSGIAAFVPLSQAKDLYSELRPALPSIRQLDAILEKWRHRSQKENILQLSDLHFGNQWAQEKEPYLSTHLHSISGSVARIVITGDLFDGPEREKACAFHSFRTALERQRGEEALVIPGNHDQKWRGNLNPDLREIEKLEWSSVFVDDKTRCVFFCFDSSRDAVLARGKVSREQRLQVATQFDKLCLARPDVKDYLRVVLVHHHPFTFETPKETLVSRCFEKIGITDEYFLRMDDADDFLAWCANRNIGLILHGHKHVPRYREEHIQRSDASYQLISTVGCGTSLGAEGKPLSYNVVAWDARLRRWIASFWVDPGDGSGFRQELLSATPLQ